MWTCNHASSPLADKSHREHPMFVPKCNRFWMALCYLRKCRFKGEGGGGKKLTSIDVIILQNQFTSIPLWEDNAIKCETGLLLSHYSTFLNKVLPMGRWGHWVERTRSRVACTGNCTGMYWNFALCYRWPPCYLFLDKIRISVTFFPSTFTHAFFLVFMYPITITKKQKILKYWNMTPTRVPIST